MTFETFAYLFTLFVVLFLLGTVLCLWQAGWNAHKFFQSSLWVKILFWIPIFIAFLSITYLGSLSMLITWAVIGVVALIEWRRTPRHGWIGRAYISTFLMFSVLAGCFFFITGTQAIELLIIVCFCSVMSDVVAYFFGTVFGRHSLPDALNHRKSWEGVAGQIIGALAGALLISPIITEPRLYLLALIIGIASAAGDLFNSAAKRQVKINDWGQSIPGHGGVMDRFSSLSFAFAATCLIALV